MDIVKIIADAIQKADKSYFFENYSKQARSVIKELDQLGYVLMPKEPNAEMIKAGVLAITIGNVDARKLARDVYKDMIEADN